MQKVTRKKSDPEAKFVKALIGTYAVGDIIGEPMRVHGVQPEAAARRALESGNALHLQGQSYEPA